jgi:hypothetical protein
MLNAGAEVVLPRGLLAEGLLSTANTALQPYAAPLFTANTAAQICEACFRDMRASRWLVFQEVLNTFSTPVARVVDFPQTETVPDVAGSRHISAPPGFRARDAIFELRRLTDFTWEELAKLLSVTRRSLHLWANGHPINTANETHLRDLLTTVRSLDRGTARENRELLISPLQEAGIFSDLLRDRRFDAALAQADRGRGRVAPLNYPENAPARAVHMSIEDTFSTRSDRVHIDDGAALLGRRRPRQA